MLATGEGAAAPARSLSDLRALATRLDEERKASSGSRSAQVAATTRSLAIQAVQALYSQEVKDERDAYGLGLPFSTAWVLARALSGDPARGFTSYAELIELLAPPFRRSRRPSVSRPRKPLPRAALAILGTLVLVVAAAWLAWERPTPLAGAALLLALDTHVEARRVGQAEPDAQFEFGARVAEVACDSETLYASLPDCGQVARVHLATGELLAPLPVGRGAGSMAVDPAGGWLAVAYPRPRLVKLWLLGSRPRPVGTLGLEESPKALAGSVRALYVRLETGRVEALSVPSLQTLPGPREHPRFPDPLRTWWPGP